jgi:hypothetical protein
MIPTVYPTVCDLTSIAASLIPQAPEGPRKPTIGEGGCISKQRVKDWPWSDANFTLLALK